MLLLVSTTYTPATDLGYLLHKNPYRAQAFELPYGKGYVFFPEAKPERCTAALVLDVDPVTMVRGKQGCPPQSGLMDQYVNDRPYVASSMMSVALARVFGSALQGKCSQKPELAQTVIPLHVRIPVLPCHGGVKMIERLFEPLGYKVHSERIGLDPAFPEWGDSHYYSLELDRTTTLSELLTHLYVLMPVLDDFKHYYIVQNEVENLLAKGEGWLATHPDRDLITRRYLKHLPSLAAQALARLDDILGPPEQDEAEEQETLEEDVEVRHSLNEQRLDVVRDVLKNEGVARVLDLGCGQGKLIRLLFRERQFTKILGMDVSIRALEIASAKLRLSERSNQMKERVELIHGSLIYRDKRLAGFDAAAVVEVVEHLDPMRLKAFERCLFQFARPRTIVLTTPNREYNVMWENVGPDRLRHADHRFEWTRKEFETWAQAIGTEYGYATEFVPVGEQDPTRGAPTQMCVFRLEPEMEGRAS